MHRALVALPLLLTPTLSAAERLDAFQWQGYLSQGFVLTDHNNFFGDSESGSWDFRELGLNMSWQMAPRTLLAAQVLSRSAGETDNGQVHLDYGILDHRLVTNSDITWGVQLGRFKNPYGLYNEARDVPFTRPSIILPQSIYFDRTRTVGRAADGLSIYHERRAGPHDIQIKGGFGYPQINDPAVEAATFRKVGAGRFHSRPSTIAAVVYDYQGGKVRIGATAADVNAVYTANGDPLGSGDFRLRPLVLSGQYNAERWSWIAEYALREVKVSDFNIPDERQVGESGYLQVTRRIGLQWEAFLRYDVLYADRTDRSGERFAAQNPPPAHTRFAKDWTVGGRWMPTPSWMIAAEWHHVDGTGWLPHLDNRDPIEWERRWNMFLMSVSYRF